MKRSRILICMVVCAAFAVAAGCGGTVKCGSYDAGSGQGESYASWNDCSDGKVYSIECKGEAGNENCVCMMGDAKGKEFSGAFGSKTEGEKMAMANEKCGWKLGK